MCNNLEQTLQSIEPQDLNALCHAKDRLECLTMPHWALGRMMDLALELAGITGRPNPKFDNSRIVVMASDHGVAEENVSKYPQAVTLQMLHNFIQGGASINAFAKSAGAELTIVDMGVIGADFTHLNKDHFLSRPIAAGTNNISKGPAMSKDQALCSIETGIAIAHSYSKETDLFATGDMGIANTTSSAAIISVLTNTPIEKITGRGTGVTDEQLKLKIEIIKRSIEVNQPDSRNALDVLKKVGGFEIGGIAGLILGAASKRKPVLIDGFISTAAALIAEALSPESVNYMIAAHQSTEPGHSIALDHLNKKPLLDLSMRLGEGTGAALAIPLVKAASRILSDIATFEEATVSQSDSI